MREQKDYGAYGTENPTTVPPGVLLTLVSHAKIAPTTSELGKQIRDWAVRQARLALDATYNDR